LLRAGRLVALDGRDLPVLQLFEKLNFIVVITEVWVQLSIIPKVVKHVQEGLAISVQEEFTLIVFLKFNDSLKPLVKK